MTDVFSDPDVFTDPNIEIVLASASVSRARMLKDAGLTFATAPAYVDEESIKQSLRQEKADALAAAEMLAELKAVKVSTARPEALVIGADTILDFKGTWFDKPADLDHAKAHLMTLRGQSHHLATAVVIALEGKRIWHARDLSELTMRDFSDAFIDQYIAAAGEVLLTSVGAYQLEGLGAHLFDRINGDFFSILGLPLLPVLSFLRDRQALVT